MRPSGTGRPIDRFVFRHLEPLACLLALGVFAIDLSFPPGSAVALLYVLAVMLGLWTVQPRSAIWLAVFSTSLLLLEVFFTRGDGDWRVVGLNRGLSAVVIWLTAIGVTVHRQQNIERDEAEQHARDLQYALEQSAIVSTTDVTGAIMYVNDRFCEISKYTAKELVGQNHRVVNSGFHPREFFAELYRTIGAGRVWRGEIRNRAKDGSLYWVDATVVPFMDRRGRPYQYVSMLNDITERKRSEEKLQAQAALAQLGKMAAVVAHEVRNPLAGIRGALQMLDRRCDAQGTEHRVIGDTITRLDTLSEIVEDLLLFARPRTPAPINVPFDLLARETVRLLRNDPKLTDVAIEIVGPAVQLRVDPELMKLVLLNLLINSTQAMDGRGRITIRAVNSAGWQEIHVVDEGPGISPDVRARLFEPFFTTKHRGTGLGLATARRIAQQHGGELELTCPSDGGTTAIIRLPGAHAPRMSGVA